MRKIVWLTIFVPIVLLFFSFQQSAKDPVGKISFYLNRVFIIPSGSSNLRYAQFNMDVFPGDKIETKKESRCELTLRNGDIVRIDENSIFTLEDVEISEQAIKAESFLSIGKIWSNIKKIFTDEDKFKVKSPSAVIAVRGTIYRVNANEDTTTEVIVYDGEVEVGPQVAGTGAVDTTKKVPEAEEPKGPPQEVAPPEEVPGPTEVAPPEEVSVETWLEIVKAQQQIIVKPDGSYEKMEYDMAEDAKLDWVQWNKKRDELLER
ncbi:hypothetical protein GWN26_13115 [Candidatus Saccharibacteria bacterium]|nr:hypothetical protein [Calditrichia bacterium]NIW00004.1 hypothetical protein [Candidatus Saccharibacteria bacterium]